MKYIRKSMCCATLLMLTALPAMAAAPLDHTAEEAVAPSDRINGQTPAKDGISLATPDDDRIASLIHQGRISLLHKEYDAALDSFMQAYRLNPQDKDTIHSVMTVHIRKGNYTEAVSFLEKAADALDSEPDRREIHEIIAMVYYKKALKDDKDGKAAQAEISLRKAVSLGPDSPHYLVALARVRHKAGSFDEAEKLLVQGLERFTDEPSRKEIGLALERIRLNEMMLRKIR